MSFCGGIFFGCTNCRNVPVDPETILAFSFLGLLRRTAILIEARLIVCEVKFNLF
jgi:hypothetical protein